MHFCNYFKEKDDKDRQYDYLILHFIYIALNEKSERFKYIN